jgi:hypothetical protein
VDGALIVFVKVPYRGEPMSTRDPNELIRELLRVSRELESQSEEDAPASIAFLRGRRDLLLQALRAHMRRFEAPPLEKPAREPEASEIRTKSGRPLLSTPGPSRRKGHR